MRIITAFEMNRHWAIVRYNVELDEYQTLFGTNEVTHHEATYFTDDKEDAIETGRQEVIRMNEDINPEINKIIDE